MLKLLSEIYWLITTLRNRLYDWGWLGSYQPTMPVVCVGNLTVGGTGKTPLCIELIEYLKSKAFLPVLLTRGYGGTLKGPVEISGDHSPDQVGDEPLLIRSKTGIPVVVAKGRAAGAKFIEAKSLGNIIVMDDGLQHRALNRDINIACINCSTEQAVNQFLKGDLLPYGIFRESKEDGLKRTNIIVLNSRSGGNVSAELKDKIISNLKVNLPVFTGSLELEPVKVNGQDEVIAFCAIANPAGFFDSLAALGLKIITKKEFPDHHEYNRNDLEQLLRISPSAKLICTEKDWVKVNLLLDEVGRGRVIALGVKARVEAGFFKEIGVTMLS